MLTKLLSEIVGFQCACTVYTIGQKRTKLPLTFSSSLSFPMREWYASASRKKKTCLFASHTRVHLPVWLESCDNTYVMHDPDRPCLCSARRHLSPAPPPLRKREEKYARRRLWARCRTTIRETALEDFPIVFILAAHRRETREWLRSSSTPRTRTIRNCIRDAEPTGMLAVLGGSTDDRSLSYTFVASHR